VDIGEPGVSPRSYQLAMVSVMLPNVSALDGDKSRQIVGDNMKSQCAQYLTVITVFNCCVEKFTILHGTASQS
jgi:hypothetical protein